MTRGVHNLTATNTHVGKDVPDSIGLPLVLSRIMNRIRKVESGCWEYTGHIMPSGYVDVCYRGHPKRAHRLVYMALHGPIKPWPIEVVLHSCDNRKCLNPDHLSLGTQQENIRDCVGKNRQASRRKTHCPHGHAYAEHGREFMSDKCIQQATPWRSCRTCSRIGQRRKAGWPEHLLHLPSQRKPQQSAKACE